MYIRGNKKGRNEIFPFFCMFIARLFHQAFISFRKYVLEMTYLPADLHIIINDICCGAGHIDDIYPYFMRHAKQIFPMLDCLDDLRKISDLRLPAYWYGFFYRETKVHVVVNYLHEWLYFKKTGTHSYTTRLMWCNICCEWNSYLCKRQWCVCMFWFSFIRYPEARAIQRKVIFHAGPTNSGKTYQAIQRYLAAKSGVYCGPLKLLAHEIFEKSNTAVCV